jgi:hypothetical protein
MHEIEPTNLSRRNIIRGPDWIKSQWGEVWKNLHQMFVQYNHSGQHDPDMDEWGSDEENHHWARAASWRNPGSNTVIRFQQAMIYSIALLDQCDFESIGHKMPNGSRVDASLNDGAVAPKHKPKKRPKGSDKKRGGDSKAKRSRAPADAIEAGSEREAKMKALHLFLEFGDEGEKQRAKRELQRIAFSFANQQEAVVTLAEHEVDDKSVSTSS